LFRGQSLLNCTNAPRAAPQYRTVMNWLQPSAAERYEIYSELGLPQAVLTIDSPVQATLESRFGTYLIERKPQTSDITVSDAGGSLVVSVHTGWWGRRYLTFHDGSQLNFNASNVFRSRWIWRNKDGDLRAVVQRRSIFFSPDWPIREGLSALLTGLSIYFIVTKPSLFNRFKV
jgi:hypothetical protein